MKNKEKVLTIVYGALIVLGIISIVLIIYGFETNRYVLGGVFSGVLIAEVFIFFISEYIVNTIAAIKKKKHPPTSVPQTSVPQTSAPNVQTQSFSCIDLLYSFLKYNANKNVSMQTKPNGEKILFIEYQIGFIWDVVIEINELFWKAHIYAILFIVNKNFEKDTTAYIDMYNRKDKQLRLIRHGDFVIADRTVDLNEGNNIMQIVREADAFAEKIDNLFRTIPKNLIGR